MNGVPLHDALLQRKLVDGGGVVRRSDLLASGMSRGDLDRAVRHGTLTPVRRGWLAVPGAHQEAVRAVRLGGALTCVSALALHSVWTPIREATHVRLPHHARKPRAAGLRLCSSPTRLAVHCAVDPLRGAWQAAFGCLNDEDLVAVTDNMLNQRLLTVEDIDALPPARRRRLRFVDGRAQAGTESLVRHRLRRRGIVLHPQAYIADVGYVDLLVGDRLVIECDSKEHHMSPEAYTNDRRRDRALLLAGYLVMRLTWNDVMFGWPRIEREILHLVRTDAHRRWELRVGPRRGARGGTSTRQGGSSATR